MKSLADAFEDVHNEFKAGRYLAAWAHLDIIVANTKMPYTGIINLYNAWLEAQNSQVNA